MKKISFKSIFTVIISAVIMLSICTFNSQSIETEASGSKSRDYLIYTRYNHQVNPYTLTQSEYSGQSSRATIIREKRPTTYEDYVSGCVKFFYKNGDSWEYSGNGFIVGENTIATAGHVVADKEQKYIYTGDGTSSYSNDNEYKIALYNPDGSEYGRYSIESVQIPKLLFESANQNDYDYARVSLDGGENIDWDNFNIFDFNTVLDGVENLTGNNKPVLNEVAYNKVNGNYRCYLTQGYITALNDYKIYCDCNIIGNDSGCPMVITKSMNGKRFDTVTAITTQTNSGIRITSPIIQFYCNNTEFKKYLQKN